MYRGTPAKAPVRLLFLTCVWLAAGAVAGSAQTLPSPWTTADIGSPALAGNASAVSTGTFTVDGAGTDIWGYADQFRFVYRAVSGDVDVRAHVDDITYAQAWAKAGVMIRASLAAGSAHAFATTSAGKGLAFQRRTAAGGVSTHTAGALTAPPHWVRLVRRGTRVTAYTSATGASWSEVGSDTIALGTTAYVGLAVTSHNTSVRATARFSNVTVTALGLPAGQLSADIGAPSTKGSVAYSNGAYLVTGAGADIWSGSDQFHYVYQRMAGDGTVIARVAALQHVHRWTKAGLMIRESLAATAPHASVFVTSGMGYAFQWRPEPGGSSQHTGGPAGVAPGWLALVREGTTVTAYQSSAAQSWREIGSAAIAMADAVYVGIAVTSHEIGAAATAMVDNFQVTEAAAPANVPPLVRLTSPVTGFTYTAPATIPLAASASDPEGRMATVEFYNGTTLVGRDTTSPYTLSWGSVPAGTYTIKALAIDADGATATSESVSVSVGTGSTTTAPRYVAFTASVDHATAVTTYRLAIYRSGADPASATPIATSDLGKATPSSSGEILVDRAAFFAGLPAGTYVAAVSAVGPGGESQSAAVAFSR
jgi:regulation of enolase protein 1 (concanavalin A-like superfamily)